MKFLTNIREGQHIAPLKIMYDNQYNGDDILSIVYKDIDTGKKYVENIERPMYELYIVKPEYRNDQYISDKFMHEVIPIEMCDKYKVRYKYRANFAAEKLGISVENVAISPYVANYDIDIENWYFIQFITEYPYHNFIPIQTGYVDIETDITHTTIIGECPIVCITYISETNHTVYNMTLNDDRYKGMEDFVNSTDKFIAECKESFNLYDSYGGQWEYECMSYDSEQVMLEHFWRLLHIVDDDFVVAWNAPFDFISLVERTKNVGLDAFDTICDKRFNFSKIDIVEDTQIKVTKRRHKFDMTVIPVMGCLMTMYANVNSAGSVIPSFKLNVIANMVLKDKKVEYLDKYKNIMDFLYDDFYMFDKYNIKDVFLMVGINHEAHVIEDVFSRTYAYGIQFPTVFSSNHMLQSVLIMEFFEMGYVVGLNRNKFNKEVFTVEYTFDDDTSEEEFEDIIGVISESQNVYDENGEKKKFNGAIVMNPLRMSSTGYEISGAPAKYVHTWAIDMDIKSEYPTAMCLMNMSNDTFVGKLILNNANDFKLPIYDAYEFFGTEREEYSCNDIAVLMETVSQRDFVLAGKLGFGLPDSCELEKELKL